MSLEIMTSVDGEKAASKSTALLNKYLKSAMSYVSGTKSEAKVGAKAFAKGGNEEFNEYYNRPSNEELKENISVADVMAKQKAVKDELKQYGLKEKMNYALNTKATTDRTQAPLDALNASDITLFAISAIPAVPLVESNMPALAAIPIAASVGLIAARYKLRKLSEPRNVSEVKKVKDYADLKHSQLALKQLKKMLTKNEPPKTPVQNITIQAAMAKGITR